MNSKSLHVGVARRDITPAVGIELTGYGPYLRRTNVGVHMPLYARALYIESDSGRLLTLFNDLVGVSEPLAELAKRLIGERCGLRPEQINLTATHTHSGPCTNGSHGWGAPDSTYLARLPWVWVNAARQAIASARPARGFCGSFDVPVLGGNRTGELEAVDRQARVLAFQTDGRWSAVLFNHAMHPVVFGQSNRMVSGDWAGALAARIEAQLEGCVAMYSHSMGGDINPNVACRSYEEGAPHVERIGQTLADAAVRGLSELEPVEGDLIESRLVDVALPVESVDVKELQDYVAECDAACVAGPLAEESHEKRIRYLWAQTGRFLLERLEAGDDSDARTQVLVQRVGDVGMVTAPWELYYRVGRAIIDNSPFRTTLVLFGNGANGYMPDPAVFQHSENDGRTRNAGGAPSYALKRVPLQRGLRPLKPQAAARVIDAAVDALKSLHENR